MITSGFIRSVGITVRYHTGIGHRPPEGKHASPTHPLGSRPAIRADSWSPSSFSEFFAILVVTYPLAALVPAFPPPELRVP